MQHQLIQFKNAFRIALCEREVQAAEMVIAPGDHEGGSDNRHRGADQWLFVIEGSGEAIVEGTHQRIEAGSLLVIAKGERHAIRNTGDSPLKTLNFYYPPAYDADGDELPAGES